MKTSYSKSPMYKTRAATRKKAQEVGNTDVVSPGTVTQPGTENVDEKVTKSVVADVKRNKGKQNTHNVYSIIDDEEDKNCSFGSKELEKILNDDNPDKRLPVFLCEPFHTANLVINDDDIENLKADKENSDLWLSTNLLDFLIKHSIPLFKPEDMLVPTSNIEWLLDLLNKKAESRNKKDQEFVKKARDKYKNFSMKPFRITSMSCQNGHFFVIFMIFDASDKEGDFFQYIKIYDSLRRNYTKGRRVLQLENSSAITLLKKYQQFFKNYILYDTDHKEVLTNPEYILQDVSYHQCPIQDNSYDCGLFALGILIHLVRSINITSSIFHQKEITYFRKSLYIIFKASKENLGIDSRKWISTEFITSFFPFTYTSSNQPNLFLEYLHSFSTSYNSPTKVKDNLKIATEAPTYDDDINDSEDINSNDSSNEEDDNDSYKNEEEENTDNENDGEANSDNENIVPFYDEIFKECFLDTNNGKDINYFKNLDELSNKISDYENESKIKLRIQKSVAKIGSRLYTCVSHEGCKFRAAFGPRRGNKQLILKNYYLYHNGYDRNGTYSNGKRFKKAIEQKLSSVIETIESIKSSKPVPYDIVKATKTLEGEQYTYQQAHKVLTKKNSIHKMSEILSYQLLIPYMEMFVKLNPGTHIDYEKTDTEAIDKIFICPGIMNNKLRCVHLVASLDAAHLTTDLNGTLYVATIKSGNDEIVPIAIGMTQENENYKGWKFFLQNLNLACGILTVHHRLERCHEYKLFSFISDRDKGLIPAIREVFPSNHHTNCLFHIRANVISRNGLKAGDKTESIGHTFSQRQEEKLLLDLRKINEKAEQYILSIDPKTWRNTEWIRNQNLPPRYGIFTSNNAESSSSMFKNARSHNWLRSLDQMLHIIQVRNEKLKNIYMNKKGLIASYQKDYKKIYDESAKYNVIPANEEMSICKIYMGEGNDYNIIIRQNHI